MKNKNKSFFPFVPVILCALLILGAATVFSACAEKEDGTWMHCHEAQNAVIVTGAVLAVLFLAAALTKAESAGKILTAAGTAGAAVVFFIPGTIISMCMMQTMRCFMYMQPFVRIMSILIFMTGLFQSVRAFRSR